MTGTKGEGTKSEGNGTEAKQMVGSLEPYILENNFDDYLAGVTNYFALNEISDDLFKVRLLINKIGTEASAKIMKAVKPKSFTDYKFDEIVKLCKNLFGIQRNSIVEHFKLNNRNQKEGESLSDFALELQSLAEYCEFGNFLDVALRDRFVAGVRSTRTKKVLLGLKSTTKFGEAVEAAKREELLQLEAGRMEIAEPASINKVQTENFERRDTSNRAGGKFRGNKFVRERSNHGSEQEKSVHCYFCKKVGHYARNCYEKQRWLQQRGRGSYQQNRGRGSYNNTNHISDSLGHLNLKGNGDEEDDDAADLVAKIDSMLGKKNKNSIEMVKVTVENSVLSFEVDTGSKYSVISSSDYKKYFRERMLRKIDLPLSVVTGEKLKVLGNISVRVKGKGKQHELELVVIETKKNFIPLLGRVWLNNLCPKWREAFKLNKVQEIDGKIEAKIKELRDKLVRDFKNNYKEIFDNDLSKPIKNITVDMRMNENAKGFVHKPYTVPFSIREKVEKQIDGLEKAGIIKRVEYAEWASPMVIVKKPNGDIRACLDGSKTINPFIETNHYPIPLIDDLLVNKSDARWFTVLDLKGAYTQLCVSESTKQILGINTIKGLYVYNRLPFGVKPAASIFQSAMDKILEGIDNVQAYIDDVLIWGKDPIELCETMKQVFERLTQYNVKVNLEKCQWMVKEVKYLGHRITQEGIKPNTDKIKAIVDAPVPDNVTQLKSFVGMVMFYSKFLKNVNGKLSPMYKLLQKGHEWNWTVECQEAFEACKKELCGDHVLMHYDSRKPIVITCDASDSGISGVLSHRVDGEEKPVFYISRTLTKAEKKYPILHREALAMVFSMEKFYKYVYGHFVEIFTDHKPLLGIFKSKKGEPSVIASRLQRYIIRMSIFDYSLSHRKGKNNGNADGLSRLPIEDKQSKEDVEEEKVCAIRSVISGNELVLDVEKIRQETEKDEMLARLKRNILDGWKNGVQKDLKHFYDKNEELGVEMGCVMVGERVVIPTRLKQAVLSILHTNHLGLTRMKQIARQFVYWQGINKDVELFVRQCESCQILRKDDKKKVYGKWPEPAAPFERVHIDFFHFKGKSFLIFVDAFSRWIEVRVMRQTTAQAVIKELAKIFLVFGFPGEVVADNGPPFGSVELKTYLESKGIVITHSPPYHPQSNGLAERAVQTVKSVLRKVVNDSKSDLQMVEAVEIIVSNHRNLPSTTDKIIPSHRILAYEPRTAITSLKYNKNVKKDEKANSLREFLAVEHNVNKNEFKRNDEVLYLSKTNGYAHALRAKIVKINSRHTYWVNIGGALKLAHVNQLRKSILKKHCSENPIIRGYGENTIDEKAKGSAASDKKIAATTSRVVRHEGEINSPLRRSTRTVKLPERFVNQKK
jgi:RNase H-like domain found in reverse transcriptase/Reverse transcriptase (RNA-dependent DNA polymerase)/Integrase zinc binding domain/Integrase core domain